MWINADGVKLVESIKKSQCKHDYYWHGNTTCRCSKCGKVVSDEEAEPKSPAPAEAAPQ